MKLSEFVARLKPDKNNLDQEYEEQPELFYRVSHMHVRACADRDNYRAELEIVETGLFNKFREEADKDPKGSRVTDTSIRNRIAGIKEVQKLRVAYYKAKQRAEELLPLKEGYTQRGHSIRGLMELYTTNYYQTDSGGRQRNKMVEQRAAENREKVKKLKRKEREEES